jgi:hypothetical protein
MSYQTDAVIALTGIDPEVLKGLLNARRIVPDVAAEVGRGRVRLFSHRNLLEVALAREFQIFKIPSALLEEVLNFLRRLDGDPPADLTDDERQRWLEVAEVWARLRSWAAPVSAFLRVRPDGETGQFDLLIGQPIRTALPAGRPVCLFVDLLALVAEIQSATGEHWPAELMRPLDDEVWGRIQDPERK